MRRDLMTVASRRPPEPFIRTGTFALASFLVIALAPSVRAQSFDEVISSVFVNGCGASGITPIPGSNLANNVCPGGTAGPSGGSATALSRESAPVEERKVERLIGPFNVFISGEYETFNKDVTRFEPGHTADIWRATLGADYALSKDRFVLGVALNYANENGNFRSGGRFDTDSYGALIHASLVPAPKFFIDVTAGYARKDYFISRAVSFTTIADISGGSTGDTDGNEFKVGVNTGYDFNFDNITIGPRLGLNYRRTEIDGFRERGNTGLELVYESQRENSLTSTLGVYGSVAISTGFGVLVPQTTLEYVHEFQDPQRRIQFRFAEDLNRTPFRFENDPPDRNYFNLGVGIVAVLPHGFSPFANYRALVGYKDQSSHIVTAGLRVEF